jgi:hypothetical protein
MKATLIYDDEEELRTALDGAKWKYSFWELKQFVRAQLKYNDDLTSEQYEAYEQINEQITDILINNNLNIYE